MDESFYNQLARQSIAGEVLPRQAALDILTGDKI